MREFNNWQGWAAKADENVPESFELVAWYWIEEALKSNVGKLTLYM